MNICCWRSRLTPETVHGLGASLEIFSPLLPELSEGHKVILYDCAGEEPALLVGTEACMSLPQLLDDAIEILALFSPSESVTVIAHAEGCLLAGHLAASHPILVDGLVLLNPVVTLDDDRRSALRERASMARTSGMFAIADSIASLETPSSNTPSRNKIFQILSVQDSSCYAEQCEALAGAENPEWTRLRETPVLAVSGDLSSNGPYASHHLDDEILRKVHDVTTLTLASSGLWPTLEAPQKTGKMIVDFW